MDDEIKLAQLIKDDPNILKQNILWIARSPPLYLASLLHVNYRIWACIMY